MRDCNFIYDRRPTPTRLVNHIYEVTDCGKRGLKVVAHINCDRPLFENFGLKLHEPMYRNKMGYAVFFIPRAMLDENGKVANEITRRFLMMVYRPF